MKRAEYAEGKKSRTPLPEEIEIGDIVTFIDKGQEGVTSMVVSIHDNEYYEEPAYFLGGYTEGVSVRELKLLKKRPK